jgi:membrane associated rhomboid family serine protease
MAAIQRQVQFNAPSPSKIFTPAVTVILVVMVGSFLFSALVNSSIINLLGLSRAGLKSMMVWQLATYSIVTNNPMQLVFNGLAVLFLGSTIERQWRTLSFVILWLVVSVTCGIIWILVNYMFGLDPNNIAVGATPCVYGMLGTFGLLFRGRRFFMMFATIEAKYLVYIMIAIGILMAVMRPLNLVWILGAPVAYLYTKMMWKMRGRMAASEIQNTEKSRFVDLD